MQILKFQSKKKATINDLEDMHVVRLKILELQELSDSIYKRCITRYEKMTGDCIKSAEKVEELYANVVGEFEARQTRSKGS